MKLSLPARKMLLLISISTAVLIVGGFVLSLTLEALTINDTLPIALGILLTSSVNALKVFMLENQVERLSTKDDPREAKNYASIQALLRHLLTAAGLVAAGLVAFHFLLYTLLFGAIAGAFTWHIAIYSLKFIKLDED